MRFLGNLQLFLLAAVAFSLIASALVSAAVPLIVRSTSAWAPASRHRALVLLGVAVPLLTLAALASAVLPSLLAFAWPELDHCEVHEGHAHLCFVHASQQAGAWLGWGVIAAAAFGVAARVGTRGSLLWTPRGLVDRMLGLARFDAERGTWIVPAEQPFCITIGLFRPRVVVSEGLLAAASEDELEVMLAHEVAHVRQRHTLARFVVRAGSLLLLPRARGVLLVALELSAEQACDEAAAGQIGDRLRVAETIVAMERRLAGTAHGYPPVAAFGASSVAHRVESMLLPPRQACPDAAVSLLLTALVVGVLALSPRLHHLTESTLAFLAH